jgi:hypothetical protein
MVGLMDAGQGGFVACAAEYVVFDREVKVLLRRDRWAKLRYLWEENGVKVLIDVVIPRGGRGQYIYFMYFVS